MKLAVPYIPLSQERRSQIESLLCRGNLLLKKYHEIATTKSRKIERSKFLNEVSKATNASGCCVLGVTIPLEDAQAILAVKRLESEVICGFSPLLTKIVNKKVAQEIDSSLSFDDLMSEACHATLRAISNYTDIQYRLSTFIYNCVGRHLSRVCGTTTPMSCLSTKTYRNKVLCKKLMSEEGATFDSAVQIMGLKPKQISILASVLCSVSSESALEPGEYVKAVVDQNNSEDSQIERKKISQILDRLDLSELEMAVLRGFVNSSTRKLGLGDESKSLINPRTNKPYSRMALTYAWRRVKEKIESAYKNAA